MLIGTQSLWIKIRRPSYLQRVSLLFLTRVHQGPPSPRRHPSVLNISMILTFLLSLTVNMVTLNLRFIYWTIFARLSPLFKTRTGLLFLCCLILILIPLVCFLFVYLSGLYRSLEIDSVSNYTCISICGFVQRVCQSCILIKHNKESVKLFLSTL